MRSARRFSYIIGLGLVIAFGFWLMVQVNQNVLKTRALPTHTPDAYVENLKLTRLNEQGLVKTKLYAKKAVHYPDEITDIDEPYAILYQADKGTDPGALDNLLGSQKKTDPSKSKPPWTIKAEHGQLRDSGEILLLWGNVHIEQAKSSNTNGTILTTTKLTYHVKTRKAETDRPVKIKQSTGSVVTATGMKADLNTGNVEFLSNMRGRYELQ